MKEFSESIVNQKFKDVFEVLVKQGLIKGKTDIAASLGTYNHIINNILKGQRNITVDQLHKLFELYNINANYLFGLSTDMFLSANGLPVRSLDERTYDGKRNIVMVPDRAVAGYAIAPDEYFTRTDLPRFGIPGYEGNLVAFEISGDSMMPTITNGDIVVCQPLERGEALRDNQVYVVVSDVVVAKRIQQVKEGAKVSHLKLLSDNNVFRPYEIEIEEVQQILRVRCRLTRHAIE